MIAKKTNKADLERKRFAFFQIGLLVAGSVTLLAFEYSSATLDEKKVVIIDEGQPSVMYEPVYEEVIERPEPVEKQQTSSVMTPIDDLNIKKNLQQNQNQTFTNQIIITDPCKDCKEIGGRIEEEEETLEVSEIDPEFIGGYKAMQEFIQLHVAYPELAYEMGIQGTINVHFVVNKNGSISNVTTSTKLNKELEAEAIRVVSIMPNWKPGEQAGKPVSVKYTIPINFIIK